MVFTYTTETGGTGSGQTQYTITAPAGGITCDILMIGGGGGGGYDRAGGGGAGALILSIGNILSGTNTIRVGNGGAFSTIGGAGNGTNGFDSQIVNSGGNVIFRAKGGGLGGTSVNAGNDGGSGGGASSQNGGLGGNAVNTNVVNGTTTAPVLTTTYGVYGNRGGRNIINYTGNLDPMDGAGGGGIGEGGSTSGSLQIVDSQFITNNGGKGGDGLYFATINGVVYNFKNDFNVNGIQDGTTGNYFIGGGGGGGDTNGGIAGIGGKGGGGAGGESSVNGESASGFGSGGGGGGGFNRNGGNGSAGIIVIRYLNPASSSSIELLRGTTIDNKTDYKIGNYDGSFKVKLAVNNYEADVLSVGEVGGIVSFPFGITTPLNISALNVSVSTLNNINPSDWLRKSECVLYLAATTRTQGGLWTSVFHIPANTIRSYYPSPQVNWRLRIGYSVADTLSTYVYGFFLASYDQYYNLFSSYIELQNSGGGASISQNWDSYGGNRLIITIINDNSPRYLNINIA